MMAFATGAARAPRITKPRDAGSRPSKTARARRPRRTVARDSEGARKLVEIMSRALVSVRAPDCDVDCNALVKTAIAADANWGRVVMAVSEWRTANRDQLAIG
jgi:N-acetylglutamate synthase/N-acetylornithine aminotransferase